MKNLIKRAHFALYILLTVVFGKRWTLQIDENTRIIKAIWYIPALFTPVYKLQRMNSYGIWITKAWNYKHVLKKDTDDYKIEWLLWAENNGY